MGCLLCPSPVQVAGGVGLQQGVGHGAHVLRRCRAAVPCVYEAGPTRRRRCRHQQVLVNHPVPARGTWRAHAATCRRLFPIFCASLDRAVLISVPSPDACLSFLVLVVAVVETPTDPAAGWVHSSKPHLCGHVACVDRRQWPKQVAVVVATAAQAPKVGSNWSRVAGRDAAGAVTDAGAVSAGVGGVDAVWPLTRHRKPEAQ